MPFRSRRQPVSRIAALALSALAMVAASCQGTRNLMDPTLVIDTPGGRELGVSTDYGVLFLGRTARAGEVTLTAWFGDGPNQEFSVIEPLGDGVYTADVQIRLPTTPITFQSPKPGDRVVIIGRNGDILWEDTATVRGDERVTGLLMDVPDRLRDVPDQIGAGVFVEDDASGRRSLVGLVSGQLTLRRADGSQSTYLTAFGPDQLWRLVTRRQDLLQRRRWTYREDIL